jgi:hypothetical protein
LWIMKMNLNFLCFWFNNKHKIHSCNLNNLSFFRYSFSRDCLL